MLCIIQFFFIHIRTHQSFTHNCHNMRFRKLKKSMIYMCNIFITMYIRVLLLPVNVILKLVLNGHRTWCQ